jgi:serine/threonine protein kinase
MTNILINREGLVKIIDFGFACPVTEKLRMYCGTPSYMAPEMVTK